MAKVELKKIGKVYPPAVQAVRDADITIDDQEFVVFVGPSGCGKSTTLRMIAGLEEITSGDLYIDGVRVNNVAAKNRDIAMVFQNYALYPHMTVYDNMAFGLKIQKVPKPEIERRVLAAAEILNITPYLARRPKALSGGQRQRVAVGRAIVREPKVFLFDEPLSNLDAKLRVQMRTEISALHNRLKATMVYVTHDQVEAMTMGDKIVVMKDGVIQQTGAPKELYNSPENLFVAGFIGSPPMNFFPGRLRGGEDGLRFVSDCVSLAIAPEQLAQLKPHTGKDVVLGVRPEDLGFGAGADGDEIACAVSVVEFLGSEINIYAQTNGGEKLVAIAGTDSVCKPGEAVRFHPNMRKAHFFAAEGGESLCAIHAEMKV